MLMSVNEKYIPQICGFKSKNESSSIFPLALRRPRHSPAPGHRTGRYRIQSLFIHDVVATEIKRIDLD